MLGDHSLQAIIKTKNIKNENNTTYRKRSFGSTASLG